MLADRDAFLEAWAALFEAETRGRARLTRKDLVSVFGRELDHLAPRGERPSEAVIHAALRSTANCLSRRGIPLSEVITAVALAERAAVELAGAERERAASAAAALERARMRIYSRVYLARAETLPRSCSSEVRGAATPTMAPQYRGLVGESPPMKRLRTQIEAAARGARNVLLIGESGSGKELVARAIHEAAGGADDRFVAVNCASLSPALAESELFGHARGAFTGAAGEHDGLFRAAEGGTLFLDEVSEMRPEMQAKLLRALEDRAVRPVGAVREVPVDVRVLAATNRDIRAAIAGGKFRADLYYRLSAFTIPVPPLRERRADIPALVEHFLDAFCSRHCGCILGVDRAALESLSAHDWPGNVRELRNVVEHAVTTGTSGWIGLDDLPPELRPETTAAPTSAPTTPRVPTLADAEAQLVLAAIEQCSGNKVAAARALGISRHKLYETLKRIQRAPASRP